MTCKIPQHISDDSWLALFEHHKEIADVHLAELFRQDPQRDKTLSFRIGQLYIDYSRHHITERTMMLLFSLARAVNLNDAKQKLFNGTAINHTENSAAMHMALRAPSNKTFFVDGNNITQLIHDELQHIQKFVESLHAGHINGYSDKPIKTIINIGTGGSDMGTRLVTQALADFYVTDINMLFVSNVDARDIKSALDIADPETTLFIISSKSFTTRETLMNAEAAIGWMKAHGCTKPEEHLLAITANLQAAKTFGIKDEYIFHIWNWVGGRYSVWSAIGLPIAIKIGMKNFYDFLSGAAMVDQHFYDQPVEKNLPVILALIDIWHINFYHSKNLAILPYEQSLNMLPAYIAQLFMESNGKQIDNQGNKIAYHTAPVVWGGNGSSAEHSFFQCLHQGTVLTIADLIVSLKPYGQYQHHHHKMLANCLAQSEVFMYGKIDNANPYKNIPGNRPSTTILLDELSPTTLGSLLCLYEHRCFVQAHIWNINPFDQWGVELSKHWSENIYSELNGNTTSLTHNATRSGLITYCLNKIRS